MIIIDNPSLIETFIDKPLTPSDWFEVTQEKIDEFAKSTGDFQWIHVCLLYTSPSPRDS